MLFRQKDPEGCGCHLTFNLHGFDQTFSNPANGYVPDTRIFRNTVIVTIDQNILQKSVLLQQAAPTPDPVDSAATTVNANCSPLALTVVASSSLITFCSLSRWGTD